MVQSAIASLGLFAASVSALGSAVVVNQCSYDVYLAGVPAAGGGFQQSDHTLHTGDSWSQQWTALTNNDGWSIKLSQQASSTNIMQYEYTYQNANPNIIWYDLSDVNGNPWNDNWEVDSDTSGCDPKEQAYRFATDDAYGEQSCPSAATITVTLCSSTGSNSSASVPSAVAAAPAPAVATTVAAPSFSVPSFSVPATTAKVEVSVAQASEAPAATTVVVVATTAAPAPATTATAIVSVLPQPFGALGLGSDGAVIEESDVVPGLRNAGRDAPAAPSLTTFATSVSAAPEIPVATAAAADDVIPIAGRLARRHEHAAPRHHHHHAA